MRLLVYQADFEGDQPFEISRRQIDSFTMKKFVRTTDLILLWEEEFLQALRPSILDAKIGTYASLHVSKA